MTKILFLTDFHLRALRPESRLDEDFLGIQLDKLEEAAQIAKGCDITIFGGDIFDRPDAAPSVVIRTMRVLAKWPHIPFTVVGNHDIFGYNKESVESSVIGILLQHGVIHKLDYQINLGNAHIHGLHAYDKNNWVIPRNETGVNIIVAHKMITDKVIPNANCISIAEVNNATNADVVLSGDIHFPHNVTIGDRLFLNPGSLSRMSIVDAKRQPQVVILTIDEDNRTLYELVSIPAKPGNQAFDVDNYAARLDADAHAKAFIRDYASQVQSVKADTHKMASVLGAFMRANNVDAPMRAMIEEYYRSAEITALKNTKEE